MKKILKNNQVIITALVLMIAVAGYITMTQNSKGSINSPVMQNQMDKGKEQVNDNDLYLNTEGAKDASSTKVTADPLAESMGSAAPSDKQTSADKAVKDEFADISAQDIGNDAKQVANADDAGKQVAKEDAQTGDAVLASSTINADFFSSAKVTREQTRAKNKETLMDIVNNAAVSDSQKKAAIASMIKMTETAEKESAAEILLEAKGFKDVVISIVDNGADVLINANNLTEQQMAQVEDIVKRKTGIAADKIVITPVGVEK